MLTRLWCWQGYALLFSRHGQYPLERERLPAGCHRAAVGPSWYTSIAVNEEEKEAIRKYLKSIEKDGKILNKTHSTVAWMFWEV